MRLNRFLAAAGLGSRRSCEELIASGAVVINGTRIVKLATTVGEGDDVRVNGRQIHVAKPVYLIFNKPRGIVVTRADERGRRTVYDFLPPEFATLCHVGRLDKESEGLLLLTNDGDMAQRLTHPSHEVDKEYEVTLNKPYDPALSAKLLRGIFIEGGRGRFEKVNILSSNRVKVTLRQGIKRQIRLMFYDLGYEVERLIRTRIGDVRDSGLHSGAYRHLKPRELASLAGAAKETVKEAAKKTARPTPKPRRSPSKVLSARPARSAPSKRR